MTEIPKYMMAQAAVGLLPYDVKSNFLSIERLFRLSADLVSQTLLLMACIQLGEFEPIEYVYNSTHTRTFMRTDPPGEICSRCKTKSRCILQDIANNSSNRDLLPTRIKNLVNVVKY